MSPYFVIFDETLQVYRVVDQNYHSYGVYYSLFEAEIAAEALVAA